MGNGKLRNSLCPCSSGKKYKKCHWPLLWKNIPIASSILPGWNVPARVVDKVGLPEKQESVATPEEVVNMNPKEIA